MEENGRDDGPGRPIAPIPAGKRRPRTCGTPPTSVEVVETYVLPARARVLHGGRDGRERLQSGLVDAYLLYMLIALIAVIAVAHRAGLIRGTDGRCGHNACM